MMNAISHEDMVNWKGKNRYCQFAGFPRVLMNIGKMFSDILPVFRSRLDNLHPFCIRRQVGIMENLPFPGFDGRMIIFLAFWKLFTNYENAV